MIFAHLSYRNSSELEHHVSTRLLSLGSGDNAGIGNVQIFVNTVLGNNVRLEIERYKTRTFHTNKLKLAQENSRYSGAFLAGAAAGSSMQ